MDNRSDYQLLSRELIDRFREAKADPSLEEAIGKKNIIGDELIYWYGVLLSRLEGSLAPFRPGETVIVIPGLGLVQSPAPEGPTLFDDDGCCYVVERLWYYEGSWFLEFTLMSRPNCRPYYPAEFFELIHS